MTSKANKLRSHRTKRVGRPRKANVQRYPSGQIKHAEREKEVCAVALTGRMRIHGIGNNVYGGYTLGRLYLDGRITEYEREAGDAYAEQMTRYYALAGIPFPSARAQDLHSIKCFGAETSEVDARRAREAADKMMGLEGALLRLADGPRVKTTVYNTCVLDYEIMRTMPDAQLRWLKRGLCEINWFLGLAKAREAG